jgi:hypothetical protein
MGERHPPAARNLQSSPQQQQLFSAYRSARSWRDLAAVWREQDSRQSAATVALMFGTLGKLVQLRKLPQQEQREVIAWAAATLGELPLPELDHTAVASVLAGLSKAGVNATNALHATGSQAAAADLGAALDRLLLLRTPQLQRPPPPQYFGMAALALKRLAHRPPSPWLKMFFTTSGPLLGQVGGWSAAGGEGPANG